MELIFHRNLLIYKDFAPAGAKNQSAFSKEMRTLWRRFDFVLSKMVWVQNNPGY
jgi:hypothetical protein